MEESNKKGLQFYLKFFIRWVAISWAIYQLFFAATGDLPALQHRAFHLAFTLCLLFALMPRNTEKGSKFASFLFNWIPALVGISICLYIALDYYDILFYAGTNSNIQLILGAVLILVVLEAARRAVGPALPIVCIVFICYAYFGKYLPAGLAHRGISISSLISYLVYSTESIFGVALGVSASFVFLFVLFGAFLEHSGGGRLFIDLTTSLVGHVRGGPAKVAIIASGFFGSISGSAVANVVATGSFTIPMMKKIGYKSEFAGAVEAAASSGGQFMPPVMGAAAFLMAELLSIPYGKVIIYAATPAILFYLALYFAIDLEARRTHLEGMSKEALPNPREVWAARWPMLFPLLILLYLLIIKQWSPQLSAFWAIVAIVGFGLLKEESRMGPSKLLKCLEDGSKNAYIVAAACACAGLIVGVIQLTGIGIKLSGALVAISGGNLFLLLILTMFCSLILGLGLPVTVCYLIVVVMLAPALIQLGVTNIAAHLFAMYFAVISNVTPPFALAAYAAAAVAKADPMKTGVTAFRLALAAFFIPYMVVYGNGLLLIGAWHVVLMAIISGVIGSFALAGFVIGFWIAPLNFWKRIILFAGALLLLMQGLYSDLLGYALLATIFFMQVNLNKKNKPYDNGPLEPKSV